MNLIDLTIAILKPIIIFFMVLTLIPVLIWMERKGAAYIQDRRGPNRAQILGIRLGGMIHNIADAIKLFTKEEVMPEMASRALYIIAPIVALFVATVTIAVVPFADPITIAGKTFVLQVCDLQIGLIYVLAMSSLGVYALLIAGWSGGSKFSLLGALRASAQTISYELALGLAALAIFIVTGSFNLTDIVKWQGEMPWDWNVIRQPLAFFIFFTALFAEANRLPFDLPEGESELVAGYHTEYSSMRFAMFFMGEYAHIAVGSIITATVFFGGWQIPFVSANMMRTYFPQIALIGWPLIAVSLIMVGGWLTVRFRRRFKDLRDFESMVFGVPMILAGFALLFLYVPFYATSFPDWAISIIIFLVQLCTLLVKTIILCAVFIWVRWTLPRFRYDQLMGLGWKVLLPAAIFNVFITALAVISHKKL